MHPLLVFLCASLVCLSAISAEPKGSGSASAPKAPTPEEAKKECAEGADFILNAARSRENGMTRAQFMAKLREDLQVIQSFPPALRWFAHSSSDAAFLTSESERVFDSPKSPKEHQTSFLRRCNARIGGRDA